MTSSLIHWKAHMSAPNPLPGMLPSLEQLDKVIQHCQQKIDAWRSIANGAKGLRQRGSASSAAPPDQTMAWMVDAVANLVLGDASASILLAGIEKLAEVNIAEAEANLEVHKQIRERVQSGIVVPGMQ